MLQFIAISVTPFDHVLQINLVTPIAIYNLQPACHTSILSEKWKLRKSIIHSFCQLSECNNI